MSERTSQYNKIHNLDVTYVDDLILVVNSSTVEIIISTDQEWKDPFNDVNAYVISTNKYVHMHSGT